MPKKNVYPGNCLFCNVYVKIGEGFIKMKNPQKAENLNHKRKEPRKYGVYAKSIFKNTPI